MYPTDLIAWVIECRALSPARIDNHMGRALQFFGLNQIGRVNPNLAERLHDDDDQKPITASGLMRPNGILYGDVKPNDNAWIRITGLSAEIATALLTLHTDMKKQLSAGESVTIELDRTLWSVTNTHIEGHVWAGNGSYQALIDRQANSTPAKMIKFSFLSPTTFRSQTVNIPLPTPSLVFGSLLARWMNFTSHRLRDLPQDQVTAFIQHHILISQHNIRTQLVRGKQGGKEIGFVGEVMYELAHKSDYLGKHEPELEAMLRDEHVWFARTIDLLADFAMYSSVGRKTTTGMGMVKSG